MTGAGRVETKEGKKVKVKRQKEGEASFLIKAVSADLLPFTFLLLPLLVDSFEFYEAAHFGDDHAFVDGHAAGERGLIIRFGLFLAVIPDLTVGAFAVPAEISVRDRLHRKILKAPEYRVVLRHFDMMAQDFDADKFFVRV
jgi:hypothetical protein